VSVDPEGWAHFEYVKLPEYRWGIFLADPVKDRRIGFGDFIGQPVWQEVPGEFRNQLRRLIVTQGDTEPASVEQQRWLGQRCPSLYDLRNLFQVNVEEGRHLWAMVYLLHSYFGRDGRDEAEELLDRQSGNRDKPRILDAFNEPIDNWLDFFMFTMFTDRDGKSQLMSLSESSLDPLSRTTRFMLTEEAHHMFVGETGISRILERTCQLMRESGFSEDVRRVGGIDLPTIQKHLNQWFSLSLDLHGGEVSSNAASYFANGLKGRAREDTFDEHVVRDTIYNMEFFEGGRPVTREVLMRNAMNEVLRDWYVGDCAAGVERWNRILERYGVSARLRLPDRKFNRGIGMYSSFRFDPDGHPLADEEWQRRKSEWLPTTKDSEYLLSIMASPVYELGKFANYIAPPRRGINQQPVDFEYVRTEQ
jgi:benzoyl-CoA 2,3-dioxygenase component B